MQQNKFEAFAASHLELAPCLNEQLKTGWASGRSLEYVVQMHLEYIAVRPWTSLSLDKTGFWRNQGRAEASVHYTVYFHIEGEEAPCSRAATCYGMDGKTIQDVIDERMEWHQKYWAKQDNRPIIFDAVTMTTQLVHLDSRKRSANRLALSFYLFPEGFNA